MNLKGFKLEWVQLVFRAETLKSPHAERGERGVRRMHCERKVRNPERPGAAANAHPPYAGGSESIDGRHALVPSVDVERQFNRMGEARDFAIWSIPGTKMPSAPAETISVLMDDLRSAIQRHEPVVPVVLCLSQGERLIRIVRPPPDGERHARRYSLRGHGRDDVACTRAPVVADEREPRQAECVRQV